MNESEKEIYATYYVHKYFTKGSKSWVDYEAAKKQVITYFNPTDEQYPIMIKIITDWLDL
jgi:hypothetical protein